MNQLQLLNITKTWSVTNIGVPNSLLIDFTKQNSNAANLIEPVYFFGVGFYVLTCHVQQRQLYVFIEAQVSYIQWVRDGRNAHWI